MMSKEYLEALEKIKQEFNCDPEYYGLGVDFEILESALNRLESIENADPSEALNCLERLHDCGIFNYEEMEDYNAIKQALLKAQKDEKIILGIEDYLNRRIKIEPIEDVKKAFFEIRNQLQVIKEVVE